MGRTRGPWEQARSVGHRQPGQATAMAVHRAWTEGEVGRLGTGRGPGEENAQVVTLNAAAVSWRPATLWPDDEGGWAVQESKVAESVGRVPTGAKGNFGWVLRRRATQRPQQGRFRRETTKYTKHTKGRAGGERGLDFVYWVYFVVNLN
jgi:hypothetical protein